MEHTLTVLGPAGAVPIGYAQMLRYHGGTHEGGVALAFKVLEAAFARLSPGTPPPRDRIRIVAGIDACGVVDGFECVTRAFSRQRVVLDRSIAKGQSIFGRHFYFEVHVERAGIAIWLRDGSLDPGFLALAAAAGAGTAGPEDVARFRRARADLADRIMATPFDALFDTGPVAGRS